MVTRIPRSRSFKSFVNLKNNRTAGPFRPVRSLVDSRFTRTVNLYPSGTLIVGWFRLRRLVIIAPVRLISRPTAAEAVSVRPALAQIERGAEQARERPKTQQAFIVAVHLISEAGIAVRIEADHAI